MLGHPAVVSPLFSSQLFSHRRVPLPPRRSLKTSPIRTVIQKQVTAPDLPPLRIDDGFVTPPPTIVPAVLGHFPPRVPRVSERTPETDLPGHEMVRRLAQGSPSPTPNTLHSTDRKRHTLHACLHVGRCPTSWRMSLLDFPPPPYETEVFDKHPGAHHGQEKHGKAWEPTMS